MHTLYLPRLQQLRNELETSYSSDSFGLSVLYAIRRELHRYYCSISALQVSSYSAELQKRFVQAAKSLKTPPSFPVMSSSAQYEQTEQALSVLEEVARTSGQAS